jgi:hypothetical protein
MEHGTKWYRFFIGDYKAANKKLKAVCQGALPNELSVKLGYVEAILAVQRMQATLKEHEGHVERTVWRPLAKTEKRLDRYAGCCCLPA